ncbi:P-loop NTPase fold protein [Bacillus cereus]|uniref:P-loop NTPase fold protein n=1 Tax=Bacillus cereus TaxID=1396 RepID=UPI00097595D7|nr:P-loop NTPase fold protein [Bacillus cereus]ONG61237.1 hypothetical protein BKL48_17335 [Bacillus cereus]
MNPSEQALEKFLELKDELVRCNNQVLNEANTRLKIIDTIFIDILGWSKEAMDLEFSMGDSAEVQQHKQLFADYLLDAEQNKFIVEAKKNGRYFKIPNTKKRIYSSRGVLRKYDSNASFMDQGIKYTKKVGMPFCVLSNGLQFIIIRNTRVEQPRDVIVFRDIEEIESNFIQFWDILSPYSNGALILDEIFARPDEQRPKPLHEKRIFDSLFNKYDQFKLNPIKGATEDYIRKYFDELTSDSQVEILKECYCDSNQRFLSLQTSLKNRLQSKPIEAITRATVKDKFQDYGNVQDRYLEKIKEPDGSVFVLVGGVGAGKSTFISHFYHYGLTEQNRKNIIWIKMDFLDFASPINKLDEWITNEIYKILFKSGMYSDLKLEQYEVKKSIYEEEVEKLISGMPPFMQKNEEKVETEIYNLITEQEKNREEHLSSVFSYLRNKLGKKICFVFDNTDQKTYEEQKEIIFNSFKRANIYKSIVITAIRLEQYFTFMNKATFDAYQPNIFRIEPPRVKELLRKRLEASLKYPRENFYLEIKGKSISVPISKFVKLLDNTLNNVPDVSSEELIVSLSGNDMRRSLLLFKKFIQSGNTKLYEKIGLIKNLEQEIMDFEDIFDGIALGDNRFYHSEDSGIYNIFNIYDDGLYSHFSGIYILKYLAEKEKHYEQQNGFIDLDELLENMSAFFLDKSKLMAVLEPLLKNYIIDSDIGARRDISNTEQVRISELGKYYLNSLLLNWRYLYHVLIDTPITDPKIAEELEKNVKQYFYDPSSGQLDNIKKTIEIFLKYLHERELEDRGFIRSISSTDYLPENSIIERVIKENHVSITSAKQEGTALV